MATAPDTSSPIGYGLSCTFCSVALPIPGGGTRVYTCVQPPFGVGTSPTTGAVLPSTTAGRPLLAEAIIRRLSTVRGTLPDTKIPTVVGNYGIDIGDAVAADMTPDDVGQLSASIDAQIRQDERVGQSRTTATLVDEILVVPINVVDEGGPFKLTLGINALTGDLSVLSSPQ